VLLTEFQQREAARIPPAAPTPAPIVMAGIAAAAGVPIEVVGDGPAMFSRPVVGQAEVGPIVETLRDRFSGSSEDLNAAVRGGIGDAGALEHGEADAAAHERQLPDAALLVNIAGVDPLAARSSTLDETIGGEQ
jgi:hypothetical protein